MLCRCFKVLPHVRRCTVYSSFLFLLRSKNRFGRFESLAVEASDPHQRAGGGGWAQAELPRKSFEESLENLGMILVMD